MKTDRMFRVLLRDFPDISNELIVFERASNWEDGYIPKLNTNAIKKLGINRGRFYETLNISESHYELSVSKCEVLLGQLATTERNMRQHLLVQWIRNNTDYVRLLLL